MLMIWTPAELLFLACVALVMAFLVIGEMIELKHPPRPIRLPTENERLARAMRHLPPASREALRRSRVVSEEKRLAADRP